MELVNYKKIMLHLQNMFESAEADLSVFCAMQYIPHGGADAGCVDSSSHKVELEQGGGSLDESAFQAVPHDASRRAKQDRQDMEERDCAGCLTSDGQGANMSAQNAVTQTFAMQSGEVGKHEEKTVRKRRLQMLKDLDECRGMLHVLCVSLPVLSRRSAHALRVCFRCFRTFDECMFACVCTCTLCSSKSARILAVQRLFLCRARMHSCTGTQERWV
jgi:hypothetical protein